MTLPSAEKILLLNPDIYPYVITTVLLLFQSVMVVVSCWCDSSLHIRGRGQNNRIL